MLVGRGESREELHELKLSVGCRIGREREPPQCIPDASNGLDSRGGVDVDAGNRAELGQGRADDSRLGLRRDVPEHQTNVVACRGFAVAGRVPHRTPHDRTGERVLDRRQVLDRHREGCRVESHLGVGEVVIVDQNQVGPLRSDERRHLGTHSVDIEFDAIVTHENARDEVVRPDREPVRADGRIVGRCGLHDRKRGDDAIRIRLDFRLQSVHARRLEPEVRPVREIATARDLQLGQEVGEFGVAIRVLPEVRGDSRVERVYPDPGDELLEHRTTFGVGDAIEVHLDVFEVVDGRDHRMRRRQLVLAVGPALLHRLERGPRFRPLGGLSGRDGRRPFGERLVEPEVVPPLHGDEVAEPHVREFVQDRDDAAFLDCVRDLAAEHIRFSEGDGARILHRAGIELGNEQLVVFGERIRVSELFFVVGEPLPGLLEDVVRVEVLFERFAREDAERDGAAIARGQFASHHAVGAGDEGGDVAREDRGGLERPGRGTAVHRGVPLSGCAATDRLRCRLVADDLPRGRGGDRELECRLEVGLLEDGEDTARVGHLELCVEVDLAIDRVDETVQSLAGIRVAAIRDDLENVLRLQAIELDAHPVGDCCRIEGDSV